MKTDEIVDPEDLNPFVAALPARIGKMEQFEMLRVLPRWDERERLLPHVERRHRVLRLLDYMEPLNQQLDLVERFDMAIRQTGVSVKNLSGEHAMADHPMAQAEISKYIDHRKGNRKSLGYSPENKLRVAV